MRRSLSFCIGVNAAIMVLLSLYFLIIPAGTLVCSLHEPALRDGKIPSCAFRWHRALSPRYERWARRRVASGQAAQLTMHQIAQTEWPLFGSVFYLWATDALQEAFDENPRATSLSPRVYARGAITAAAALVADPNHAAWVRQHWGDAYLQKENLFYRMLLISALTSYQSLLGDTRYEDLLRRQVESLARELDESPYGLLDDYPGQCYPVDIVPAIAAIRRADAVLGTDHAEFATRAVRGFQDTRLDRNTGLPAYVVSSKTGQARDSARGVGLSFMLIWAPQLWPEIAASWYGKFADLFWQEGEWVAGFREYPREVDTGWFTMRDVDAGPVIAGYGVAASAFGVGAARTVGDAERAYQLTAQGLAACWPLPDGTLLVPRVLSQFGDAPYLGEAATLFALTRRPALAVSSSGARRLPRSVYVVVGLLFGLGAFETLAVTWGLHRWFRRGRKSIVPAQRFQLAAWLFLLAAASVTWLTVSGWLAVLLLLTAQALPRQRRSRNEGPENDIEPGRE